MIKRLSCGLLVALMVVTSLQFNTMNVNAQDATKITNIKASGASEKDAGPQKAVDGDTSTAWYSPGTSSMQDYRRFIDLDLNGLYDVSKITIENVEKISNESAYYHYEVYASTDGKTYNKIAYKANNEVAKAQGEDYTVNSEARYLRVNVSFNSKSQVVNLEEVSVYGTLKDDKKQEVAPIEVTDFEDTKWGAEYEKFESDKAYADQKVVDEMYNLVSRVIGEQYKDNFIFELRSAKDGKDVFEISDGGNGKIVIRGNNGISLASGWNYYLKTYVKVVYDPIFASSSMDMPETFPSVGSKILKYTDYEYRYALNFCTYSYSMAFWGWDEYEEFLDWCAMNGVNLVLDIVGQEEVLRQTLKEYGYSDAEVKEYVSGPGYFAWFYMQNLYGMGGPLPDNWFEERVELGRKMHDRMQTYGITPVIQGFGGQVPVDFGMKNSDAAVASPGGWCGYDRPYMIKTYLDQGDIDAGKKDYFQLVGDSFYAAQEKVFGKVSNYYAVDPFHEGGTLPSGFKIEDIYRVVQEKMIAYDKDAIWVMQQWQNGIDESKLKGLANKEQALVLDLQSDLRSQATPMENQQVPWVWNMLHNFGGRMGMDGVPEAVSQKITDAYNKNNYMKGIGITPEALENSPIVYELLFDMTWEQDPMNYRDYTQKFAERRYGGTDAKIEKAWDLLLDTAYKYDASRYYQGAPESILNATPREGAINATSTWGHTAIVYDKKVFEEAAQLFIDSYDKYKDSPAFRYDFVDVMKQVLANASQEYHPVMVEAYRNGDLSEFKRISSQFLDLIKTQDAILGASDDYLLGTWIDDSRTMLTEMDDWTKDLFEFNARNLVTTWGLSKNGSLNDYSNRQWAGLTGDYYYSRWETWINNRIEKLEKGTNFKDPNWVNYAWEWANKKSDQGSSYATTASDIDLKATAQQALTQFGVKTMDDFISGKPDALVNVALGKEVTREDKNTKLANLTDGDTNSGWDTPDVKEVSLVVDLKENSQIKGIEFNLQQIAKNFPMAYTIEVHNGTNWVKVGENAGPTISSLNELECNIIGSKVRFNLRSTDGNNLEAIKELKVFGAPKEEINYTNLSKTGSVTFSREKGGSEGGVKVIDGDFNTWWNPGGANNKDWIQVTTKEGVAQYVDKVKVGFKNTESSDADRSYAFTLTAVDENGTTIELYKRTHDLANLQKHDFTYEIDVNRKIKSVKLFLDDARVVSNSGITAWPCVTELQMLKEEDKQLPSNNVALKKSTSATYTQSGKPSSNIVDGNESTLWVSNGATVPTAVSVDLGKDYNAQYARLVFEQAGRAFKFEVVAKDEAGNTTVILDKKDNNAPLEKEYIIPINKQTRHVTVNFTGSLPGTTPWPAVAELEVFDAPNNAAAGSDVIAKVESIDYSKLIDTDLTSSITLKEKEEKSFVLDLGKEFDLNALEVYKASEGAAQFKVEYLKEDGTFAPIADLNGNVQDKEKMLVTFDKTIFTSQLRFTFLNDTIALREIMVYEADASSPLSSYIVEVEKIANNAKVGDYAGNYTQASKDTLLAAVAQAKAALAQGVNSKEVATWVETLKQAVSTFYREGYVSVSRTQLNVAIDDAKLIQAQLKQLNIDTTEFDKAIASAVTIEETYKVTQAQLDEAAKTLSDMSAKLLPTLEVAQQFAVVKASIENVLKDAKVGDFNGQYSQASVDALRLALQTANETFATAEDQNAVITALQTAKQKFLTSVVVVDTAALKEAIAEAKTYEQKIYSKDSFAALQSVLTQASAIEDDKVSQKDADAMVTKIENAVKGLKVLDRSQLATQIKAVEMLTGSDYTEGSWTALQTALKEAQKTFDMVSVNQSDIDAAQQKLSAAYNALQDKINVGVLKDKLAAASKLNEKDYTKATWDNLLVARKLAQQALDTATSQVAIDNAVKLLETAMDQLVKKPGVTPRPEKPVTPNKPTTPNIPSRPGNSVNTPAAGNGLLNRPNAGSNVNNAQTTTPEVKKEETKKDTTVETTKKPQESITNKTTPKAEADTTSSNNMLYFVLFGAVALFAVGAAVTLKKKK